jgi:hypothetical protein
MLRYSFVLLAGLASALPALAGSWADGLFDELSKDFGSVPRGPELTHPFRIKNTTGNVVTISNVRVSCNRCSGATLLKNQLQPGEETALVAKMYTSQFEGPKTIWIYVQFSQPQFDEVRLWVQANSRADVAVTPDTLAFGHSKRGGTPEMSARVTLYGSGQSEITDVQSESNYVQVSREELSRQGTEVTYKVTARLRDDAPAGKWYTDIWLKTNNAEIPRVRLPLTVEIESALNVSTSPVALGQVKVGESAERKVILRGATPFKVTGVQGADEQLEVKDNTEGRKQVHVLTVKLKGARPGELNRTVRVITDLKDEGEIEFTAKGQVVP